MSDIISGINEMLEDPAALAKITEIAKSLGGADVLNGASGNSSKTAADGDNSAKNFSSDKNNSVGKTKNTDGETAENASSTLIPDDISGFLSGLSNINFQVSERHINLLKAIQPYMRKERSEKINSAIKAMSLLKTLSGLK